MTNNTTQHTPGPWTIQDLPHQHDFRKGVEYVIRDARNCALAQVGHIDAIHDGQESEANARLIAAAPMLLETLDAISRGLTNGQVERGETFQSMARAAIRAAKGENHA